MLEHFILDNILSGSSIHNEKANSVQTKCTYCGIFNHSVEKCFKKIRNEKDYEKQAIRKLFHANSCLHSRILIAELPEYGIKCLEKFQSQCAHMTFSQKSCYDRNFQQVTHKGGESAIN